MPGGRDVTESYYDPAPQPNATRKRSALTHLHHCLYMLYTDPILTLPICLQTVVEVRSCMVGEFLVPTGDQCMPCDAGTFNTGG
jgi:hypothetical protein